MREQFKQWSKLEPAECSRRETSVFDSDVYTVNGTAFFVSDTDLICFMPGEAEMWLQWAVQQAIAARGWYFDVAYLPLRESDDKYHADVQVTKSLEGVDADLRSAKSDNPAEALLAAYVKALEAQA